MKSKAAFIRVDPRPKFSDAIQQSSFRPCLRFSPLHSSHYILIIVATHLSLYYNTVRTSVSCAPEILLTLWYPV